MTNNEELLQEILENYEHDRAFWEPIWEEGKKDMKYLSGDPWDEVEKKSRKDSHRPALVFDELHQYVNQIVNDARINKRGIRITPEGDGATEEFAHLRQKRIQEIEYRCKAQTAYLTAFENAVMRSYGAYRITTAWCEGAAFEQEIKIKRIPIPESVLLDCEAREFDFADMDHCFVLEHLSQKDFKRKYPAAEVQDFTADHLAASPQWIGEKSVLVTEYWKVETRERNSFVLQTAEGPVPFRYDHPFLRDAKILRDQLRLSDGSVFPILVKHSEPERTVWQYVSNGIEILEKTKWLGNWIPIIPVFGKELYVDDGAGAKRKFLSAVRLAREPYMFYVMIKNALFEEINKTPKMPFIGYEGQFNTNTAWELINKVPTAYAEVKAKTSATGDALLPVPQRPGYEPQVAPLEMAAESAKRAIMSAMSQFNVSVGREDTHARSGVAIKALTSQSQQGAFHFPDNLNRAIEHGGRVLNDLLNKIENTPGRQVGLRGDDDSYQIQELGEELYGPGRYNITVTVGPSYSNQKDEASSLLDALMQIPQLAFRISDLAVKYRLPGPIGDEIAKRLIPPDVASKNDAQNDPQRLAQQLQQATQALQAMQQQIAGLMQERETKKLELDSKEKIAAIYAEVNKLKIQADFATQQAKIESKEELELLRQQFEKLQGEIDNLRETKEAGSAATM